MPELAKQSEQHQLFPDREHSWTSHKRSLELVKLFYLEDAESLLEGAILAIRRSHIPI